MNTSSRPAESLLEHADFLRRLSVQLAGTGGAEDLQQETWVASLAHPPRHGDNVRGWLRTVAGNLWRNQRRTAARRAAREREALRPDVPGVDEIAAREEVRRRVVAAVLALPEPLRQVVLLRFYEGLDSPAIGERLQRPASTVRTQLQSALERLRQRLDSEHGGERARWAAPLLGWQRFLQPPAVTAGAVAWVVRAGLLLLAVGTTLWWLQTPAPDVPLSTTAALAARDAASPPAAWNANDRVAAAPPPSVAVDAPPSHAAARPLGLLRGRVFDSDTGLAVSGARVRLRAIVETSTVLAGLPDERRVAAALASGGDGEFAFGDLPAGLYELQAEGEGDRSARARVAVGGAALDSDLWLAAQPFRGIVVVKVLTTDGRAVPGAAVTIAATCTQHGPIGYGGAPPIEGTTDARGLFRFRDPERLEHMFEGIAAATTADGRVGTTSIGRPEHRGNLPFVEITVDRPAAIEGRLQGPRADWSGTSVVAERTWTYSSAHADVRVGEVVAAVAADGTFRCEGLAAGSYHLSVRGAAGLQRKLAQRPTSWQFLPTVKVEAGQVAEAAIELEEALRLRGRVVDSGGSSSDDATGVGIAGAVVTAYSVGEETSTVFWHRQPEEPLSPYCTAVATCDARGEYGLELAPGRWHVTATAPGRNVDVQLGVDVASAKQLLHRLVADGSLRGRTARDHVMLRPQAAPHSLQGMAADDGAFAVRGLAPGRWEIGVRGEDGQFAAFTSVEIEAGRTTWLDLCAAGDAIVRGTVQGGGAPLADIDVGLDTGGPTVRTGPDGSFLLSASAASVAAATELRLRHRGMQFATVALRGGAANGAGRDFGVIEVRARRIDVRAVGANGAAVPAIFGILDSASYEREPRWNCPDGQLRGQLVTTTHDVHVRARFADGSEVMAIVGTEAEMVVRHAATGALSIRLLDRDGCPRAAATLCIAPWFAERPIGSGDGRRDGPVPTAVPTDGATFWAQRGGYSPGDRYATTDADGRLLVRGVPPGPALVFFSGPWNLFGYSKSRVSAQQPPPAEQVVLVEVGRETPVELVLR